MVQAQSHEPKPLREKFLQLNLIHVRRSRHQTPPQSSFYAGLALTVTRNKFRIAESVGTHIMPTQTCPDCDSPGDGNCSVCHGKGKTLLEKISDTVIVFGRESACAVCGGSGDCPTCDGTGEIETGGES